MIVDIQITMFNLLTIGIVTSENIWHWVWSGVACVYRLTVDELLIPPSGLQSALDDQLVSTVVGTTTESGRWCGFLQQADRQGYRSA